MAKLWLYVRTAIALGRNPTERVRILWHLTKNIRVRCRLARYHPTSRFRLPTRYGDLHLRDNFGDVTNLPDLFYRSVYRVDALADNGAIIDVGANIGLFAAWMALHNPGRRILCFEPVESNAKLIKLNCPSAEVFHVGVGKRYGSVALAVDDHEAMASAISTTWPTHDRQFRTVRLDDILTGANVHCIAFMKIDTEGMEVDVLDGARHSLRRTARVAMETHSSALHHDAIQRLGDAGLTVYDEYFDGRTGLVFANRSSQNDLFGFD